MGPGMTIIACLHVCIQSARDVQGARGMRTAQTAEDPSPESRTEFHAAWPEALWEAIAGSPTPAAPTPKKPGAQVAGCEAQDEWPIR